jgi:NADPH:quinone reductase
MIAATYQESGDSRVLEVREVERPEPGPGEVRVRIAVSGINPSDWKSRLSIAPADFQIPHQDGAGIIDAVGAGVDGAVIGSRVWVYSAAWQRRWGTAAQWTVVPAGNAVPLSDGVDFDLGAGLGVPAVTAYRCLCSDGPIAGKTVLVAGGAGAVGHAAIQIARAEGARVIATVSGPEKRTLAEEAGADAVVNYRDVDASRRLEAAAPDGVDRIVELAPATNLHLDLPLLAPGGVISVYGNEGGDAVGVPIWPLMTRNALVRFVMIYQVPQGALSIAARRVSEIAADGGLSSLPVHRFQLAEIAAAQDAVAARVVGKVLLDIPGNDRG